MVLRIALVCGCLLLPLSAAAEPRLRWDAPADCPQSAEARAQIARLLGKTWAAIESKLAVRARIRSADGQFEARIGVVGAGERVLRDAECAVLAQATAVVIALAIDPEAAEKVQLTAAETAPQPLAAEPERVGTESGSREGVGGADGTASPDAGRAGGADGTASPDSGRTGGALTAGRTRAAEARAAAERVRAAETRAAQEEPHEVEAAPAEPEHAAEPPSPPAIEEEGPEEASELRIAVAAAGAISAGIIPKLAPGARVSVSLLGSSWRAELRLGYSFPQSARLASPDVGGRVGLGSIGLAAGPRFQAGAFEVPLLAGFDAGLYDALGEGKDIETSATRHPPWLGTFLAAGAQLPWGDRLAFGLWLEGVINLLRPKFAVEKSPAKHTFYQSKAVAGRAFLEVELRFP